MPDYLRTLYKLVKLRLAQPDCKNRGFILDGSCLNVEDLKHIFYIQKKKLRRLAKRNVKKVKKVKKEKKEGDETESEEEKEV